MLSAALPRLIISVAWSDWQKMSCRNGPCARSATAALAVPVVLSRKTVLALAATVLINRLARTAIDE